MRCICVRVDVVFCMGEVGQKCKYGVLDDLYWRRLPSVKEPGSYTFMGRTDEDAGLSMKPSPVYRVSMSV